jgi:hypothetical protein
MGGPFVYGLARFCSDLYLMLNHERLLVKRDAMGAGTGKARSRGP